MKPPRLVVFDLDRTLTDSKQALARDMAELLANLLGHMPVAVMSGASFKQFQTQFLAHLSSEASLENLYLFPTNASSAYNYVSNNWQVLYETLLSENELKEIHEALEKVLKVLESSELEIPNVLWGDRIEDRGGQVTFSGLGQKAPIAEKLAWDPDQTKRNKIRELLSPILPGFDISVGGATSVDITRKGVNKASGLLKLIGLLKLNPEEVLYIGDELEPGGNDAMIIKDGVKWRDVSGPAETKEIMIMLIRELDEISNS